VFNGLYDEMTSSEMSVEAVEGRYCLAIACIGGEFEGQFSSELWSRRWEFRLEDDDGTALACSVGCAVAHFELFGC
jgi:hypothetical protein